MNKYTKLTEVFQISTIKILADKSPIRTTKDNANSLFPYQFVSYLLMALGEDVSKVKLNYNKNSHLKFLTDAVN